MQLFEGSAHETEDNLLLAAVEVALPRGPRGASTVAVTVEVDANGASGQPCPAPFTNHTIQRRMNCMQRLSV